MSAAGSKGEYSQDALKEEEAYFNQEEPLKQAEESLAKKNLRL